jgi:hypothetical protein
MRTIKIPERINISGQEWDVYLDTNAPANVANKLKSGDYGVCSFQHKAIVLAHWQSPDDMQETLIHEALHAMLEDDEWLGPELEHHVIEALEAKLTRFIRSVIFTEEVSLESDKKEIVG